jgi:hypothetical protein
VDVDLEFDNNELTVDITVGTEVPAVMQIRLLIWNQVYYLAVAELPPIDPRISHDVTIPFPNVGKVGVLITLLKQGEGVAHSVWKTVDTGL